MNIILIALSNKTVLENNGINTDLMREFVKEGHDVTVYFGINSEDKKLFDKTDDKKADIYNVHVGRVQKTNAIVKGLNFLKLDNKFKQTIKKTYNKTPDLLMYLTPPITLIKTISFLKKKYNCKSYLLLKDIFPQNSLDLGMLSKHGIKGFIYRHFKRIEKKLYSMSDYIGCMSNANVSYLLDNCTYLDKNIVEINPNPIDTSRLSMTFDESKREIRQQFDIPTNKKVFIYGGNLGKPQDVKFILSCVETSKVINDAFFVIVGDGTDYRLILEYIDKNKPNNLLLINRVDNLEYLKILSACDVGLIFLDYRFTIPNYPSRLLDYMRVGLPIYACTDLTSDIGKTIVDGKFGWWTPSNSVDGFFNTIKTICEKDIQNVKEIEHEYLKQHFSARKSYETIMKHFK